MKKLHSLFILSILALTMFVGCQMNTDDVKDILTTTYRVNVAENTYKDNVSVDNATPKAGDTVVITITVPDDFSADDLKLSVMKGTETVTFTDEESTETNKVKKSFTMPESDVEVTVNFEKKATPTETPTDTTPTNSTPTDGTGNGAGTTTTDTTPTVADFVDTTDYNVYKDNNFLATVNGRILNAICKKEGFAKDKDYTIEDGNKVNVITGSRLYDWLTPQNLGGFDSDDEGGNDDVEGINGVYSVLARSSGDYYIYRSSSESGEEVVLPIMTLEGNKPTRPYLVKVSIEDSNGNDIKSTVGLKIEDNKIKFTMPSNTVKVYAIFENVSFTKDAGEDYSVSLNVSISKNNDLDFDVGICFTEKVFDNLEYIDGKYVFRVANKDDTLKSSWFFDMAWSYRCIIETTLDTEYELCAIVGEKVKLFDEKSRWINL